ncbi:MAG: hypothetical protein GY702_00285, partial [Desulfobulbaceae bacterium]|nr:hypothetical protein [Desulfobulbaceae bacterium]
MSGDEDKRLNESTKEIVDVDTSDSEPQVVAAKIMMSTPKNISPVKTRSMTTNIQSGKNTKVKMPKNTPPQEQTACEYVFGFSCEKGCPNRVDGEDIFEANQIAELAGLKDLMETWLDWANSDKSQCSKEVKNSIDDFLDKLFHLNYDLRKHGCNFYNSPLKERWASDLKENFWQTKENYEKLFSFMDFNHPDLVQEMKMPNPLLFPAPPPPPSEAYKKAAEKKREKKFRKRQNTARPSAARSSTSTSTASTKMGVTLGARSKGKITIQRTRDENVEIGTLGSTPPANFPLRGRIGGNPMDHGLSPIGLKTNWQNRRVLGHIWYNLRGEQIYCQGQRAEEALIDRTDLRDGSVTLQRIINFLVDALGSYCAYTVSANGDFLFRSPPGTWARLREILLNCQIRQEEAIWADLVPEPT